MKFMRFTNSLTGHAGAMLQARQLGNELFVGVHSDEEIAINKGPVVMRLNERTAAVDACKWSTASVPGAPYVTDPKVMDDYGCKYVVHGDDITTDADGNDTYRIVKEDGRFIVVKRTPNISTTDLVGRMLSTSTTHHIPSIKGIQSSQENSTIHSLDSLKRLMRDIHYLLTILSKDSSSMPPIPAGKPLGPVSLFGKTIILLKWCLHQRRLRRNC